jgi:hypothetical protein
MIELAVLFLSAVPFILGLYALKILERRRGDDGDDLPPPDSGPSGPIDPRPVSPSRALRRTDRPGAPSRRTSPAPPARRRSLR